MIGECQIKPDHADLMLSETIVNLTEMVFNNEENKLLEKSLTMHRQGIWIKKVY